MDLKDLSIDRQVKLGKIFVYLGYISIINYLIVALLIGVESVLIIFLNVIIWSSIKTLQLLFLFSASSFKTSPSKDQLIITKRFLPLYTFMYLVEISFGIIRGSWLWDLGINIFEFLLLVNMIIIYQKIQAFDLVKHQQLIEQRREDERAREKERARIAEQNRITNAQKSKEEEKKRKDEELKAIEKEKLEAEERERKRILEVEETHIKKLAEITSLIKQFSFDIPVSLSRISELLYDRSLDTFEISEFDFGISESEVERLLIELLTYQEDLGEYLELEQVFIKRSNVNKTVDEVIGSTKSNPFTAIHVCSVCNTAQPVLTRRCIECDNVMPFCAICGRGFGEEDNLSSCTHCNTKFHSVHIFAYIQSKGICPVCKEKLNEKLLRSN